MKLMKYMSLAILPLFLACSLEAPSETKTTLNTGDVDFSRYVSLGNSLTAGYQSGALTQKHQEASYPYLIAKQAEVATFQQPYLGYPGIGAYTESGGGILELKYLDNPQTPETVNPDPVIAPVALADYPSFNPALPYASTEIMAYAAPYNNLGVPGALLYDVLNATSSTNCAAGLAGGSNPFFDVILRNPTLGNTTPYQQAKMLQPSFITLWIGNNDVLGYATSGGVSPAAPTDINTFTALYSMTIDSLIATGADVVVANIPDVTSIPFFTTVPGVIIDPAKNQPVEIDGNMVPILGVNPATDLVLITAAEYMKNGYGIPTTLGGNGEPLPDQAFLSASEIAVAQQAVSDFNEAIKTICAAKGVPVVDVNAFLADVKKDGYHYGGFTFTSNLVTGGLFSLDGIHPSNAGHAIIANHFIDTINENFNATVPHVNVLDYMSFTPSNASVNKVDMVSYKATAKLFGASFSE
jgi:lysophospholipase L1-like esterase